MNTTITPENCPKHALASRVDFSTSAYEFSTGHLPRGRGSWAFCPSSEYNSPTYLNHVVFTRGCTLFAEARRLAANYFAALGIDRVTVCT